MIVAAICVAIAASYGWYAILDPALRHAEFCRVTRAEFESLAHKRPAGITRKHWHHIVGWTLNAHGNCLTFSRDIPQADRDRFVSELRSRLNGQVDIATVDWIWDELVRLTSYGQTYSDNWRPTTPDRLQEFAVSNSRWSGLEVD